MNITIAVDIRNEILTEQTFQSLQNLRSADAVTFAVITDKKRYELPKHELIKIDILKAKVEGTLPTTDGVVFEIKGNEVLHELALEYIKNYEESHDSTEEMPKHIRDIIVTSVEGSRRSLSSSKKAAKSFKVSCIVPIMNETDYLNTAIDSVIAQTIGFNKNIQLILVNCNPSGKRYSLCTEYADTYPSNIVHAAKDFKDISMARNYGLSIATGEYIAFLEEDGKYAHDFMGICTEFLSNPRNAQFVTTHIEPMHEQDTPSPLLNYSFPRNATLLIRANSHYVHTTVNNVMFARVLADGINFDSRCGIFSELEFIHRILLRTGKYAFQTNSVYYKRECGIVKNLEFKDTDELGIIKHLFATSKSSEGNITRYTKYLSFAILTYYQHLNYEPDRFQLPVLHSILDELDEKIICHAFKGTDTSELLVRQFLMALKGQLTLLVKPSFELVSFSRQGEGIYVEGRYSLPFGCDYDMLITTENGHIRNYRILNHEYSWYLGFNICADISFEFVIHHKETNPFSFYFSAASGMPEEIVCIPDYAEKGTAWVSVFEGKIAHGGADSNTVNIEDFSAESLKTIVQNIMKSAYHGSEYDSDIKVVNDYMRMLELYPTASYIVVSQAAADSAYSEIARENPGAKIFVITTAGDKPKNAVAYGSREHKLYCLLAKKVYVSSSSELGYAFPYDSVKHEEFNAIYRGLVHSTVIKKL
ncbi:MAG: glycosyltransferase family 2 protein [Defluviitaleaceae bacterium]|nr:glycosyltransferase family 2 protein [Defluviitaleaceae bacterium]